MFLGCWIWAFGRHSTGGNNTQDGRRRMAEGIAGQSGRMRGCEDVWKTKCVTHESSGCQYRLWDRQRSISGIFRQPRVALTSSGCCGWTLCMLPYLLLQLVDLQTRTRVYSRNPYA